ncbi:MAG TPA: phosphatidate cytidylyltransferase [Ferruginibacter sp.]|nr:phosphatidate cytidylyltransferase [Ferruginibacter sp.]
MPLNLQTFKTRTLTAILFAVVMLVGLLWNAWCFLLLFTIIHFGCWYEFIKLIKKIQGNRWFLYAALGLLYITLPIYLLIDMAITFKANRSEFGHIHFTQPPFVTIIYSALLPCGIIFSIWINDTMAYIVGSLIGKTPFSKISPKKTWEGTLGGIILCIGVIGLLGYYVPAAKVIDVKHWFAIAAIAAICGTAGDLLESKIKRMADVKDSGTFMPGHGGFLDRFDSLLVATPFVWLYVRLCV